MKTKAYLIKESRSLAEEEMWVLQRILRLFKIEKRSLARTILIWTKKLRNLKRNSNSIAMIEEILKEADLTIIIVENITTQTIKEEGD